MIKFITQSLLLSFLLMSMATMGQIENTNSEVLFYKKKELNSGVKFGGKREREELLTDISKRYEELTSGSLSYQFNSQFWNYLDYKQDELRFNLEVGPFGGFGNWSDSSSVEYNNAEHDLFGIRGNISVDYIQRYYYNANNYTIVQINGWARCDWFKQNSTGTSVDSLGMKSNLDDSSNETKLRYGFEARAGWGFGRLNPVNNYMLAQHIVEKYYAGRIFSEKEIMHIAREIQKIKEQRDIASGHNNEKESQILAEYLNENFLLNAPGNLNPDWELGEFAPRFNGRRTEVGPYFKYFNREPDFIYGGYIQYENAKYISLKWNRNFSAGLQYNRYKISNNLQPVNDLIPGNFDGRDWINAELNLGWSYFPDLKSQFDFGVKYVPGIEVNEFTELGTLNHGVVPYLGFFSQLNAKSRVNLTFAYRISEDENMMLPGPEFSLSFYRSRY